MGKLRNVFEPTPIVLSLVNSIATSTSRLSNVDAEDVLNLRRSCSVGPVVHEGNIPPKDVIAAANVRTLEALHGNCQ